MRIPSDPDNLTGWAGGDAMDAPMRKLPHPQASGRAITAHSIERPLFTPVQQAKGGV